MTNKQIVAHTAWVTLVVGGYLGIGLWLGVTGRIAGAGSLTLLWGPGWIVPTVLAALPFILGPAHTPTARTTHQEES